MAAAAAHYRPDNGKVPPRNRAARQCSSASDTARQRRRWPLGCRREVNPALVTAVSPQAVQSALPSRLTALCCALMCAVASAGGLQPLGDDCAPWRRHWLFYASACFASPPFEPGEPGTSAEEARRGSRDECTSTSVALGHLRVRLVSMAGKGRQVVNFKRFGRVGCHRPSGEARPISQLVPLCPFGVLASPSCLFRSRGAVKSHYSPLAPHYAPLQSCGGCSGPSDEVQR